MRTFLGATGRVLVTAGILILLFVAYQLWGTGLLQARAQDDLRNQFERTLQNQSASSTTVPSSTTSPDTVPTPTTAAPTTTVPPLAVPPNGDVLGTIVIPKIGVSQYVVEGVDVADLRKGPGHYPGTSLPGQVGTVAIAGHRTTYGAPFSDLDQLAKGDDIVLRTVQGTFTYKIDKDPFAVSPDAGEVLAPVVDSATPGGVAATLTLTTCNPKFSAAERLIVQARLELPPGAQPLPATEQPHDVPLKIDGLGGETSSRTPALIWGLIALLVGLAWWYLFHRYPRWYVWFAGAVPFLVVLFFFYTYVEQLLPANY